MSEYQLHLDLAITFDADSDNDARIAAKDMRDNQLGDFKIKLRDYDGTPDVRVSGFLVASNTGISRPVPLEIGKQDYVEKMCLRLLSRAISRMLEDRDFYYSEIAYVIRAHIDPSINAGKCTPIITIVHMPDAIPDPPESVGKSQYTGDRHSFLDFVGHIELSIIEGRPFMDIVNDIADDVRIIMTSGDYTKLTSADMYNTWCAKMAT